jgi:hypothetical protein
MSYSTLKRSFAPGILTTTSALSKEKTLKDSGGLVDDLGGCLVDVEFRSFDLLTSRERSQVNKGARVTSLRQ